MNKHTGTGIVKHIEKVKRGVKGAGRALPKGEGKGEGHVIRCDYDPDPLPVIIQRNRTMPRTGTTGTTSIPPKEEEVLGRCLKPPLKAEVLQ